MKTYLQNYGLSKHVIQRNNQTTKQEMEWIGDCDGKNANIHLHLNDNGATKEIQMKLGNNDLLDLLNIPVNKRHLDQRLIQDFGHQKKHKKTKTKRKMTKMQRTRRKNLK